MLPYEYHIRDEFDRVHHYANALLEKFQSGSDIDDLLTDRDNLEVLCHSLGERLPSGLTEKTNLFRHLAWMEKRLTEGRPDQCQGDIEDICGHDLLQLEELFREWCESTIHNDSELTEKTLNLILQREFDSAIRRGFVILKTRLVAKFGVSDELDGIELINKIFGASGLLGASMGQSERQSMRDLLAGLYGTFRNKYGHNSIEAL